jgi:hypothetical protein
MSMSTPPTDAGTVISVHRTSQGLVRYRRWRGRISVELMDKPGTVLAVVTRKTGPRNR